MNVSLTPELKKFVARQVNTGLYQTASEVVRAGLRRLKDDQRSNRGSSANALDQLEKQLLRAVTALDSGEGVDGRASRHRLRKQMKEHRARA